MNALANKVHKQKVPYAHSDMHMMASLFNNHTYVSSSGTPVGIISVGITSARFLVRNLFMK